MNTKPIAIPFLLAALGQPVSSAVAGPRPEPWTLVVLPDTQYYSRSYPWLYDLQTQRNARSASGHDADGALMVDRGRRGYLTRVGSASMTLLVRSFTSATLRRSR
jgi:hypothetical protein